MLTFQIQQIFMKDLGVLVKKCELESPYQGIIDESKERFLSTEKKSFTATNTFL